MKDVKKHIQNEYIRNAFLLQNWKDIRIADIPKLCEIISLIALHKHLYKGKKKICIEVKSS